MGLSSFAGQYNAREFAYGAGGADSPGAILAIAGGDAKGT